MRTDAPVIAALMAVVAGARTLGLLEVFRRLRLDAHPWNHKHVHRVYCALRLNLPRRIKRRVPTRLRQPLLAPPMLNETWALDYMTDALYSGQRFRALTILDEGNREGLAIKVGDVDPESARRPRPRTISSPCMDVRGRCARDNGPNLSAQPLVDWCEAHGVALHYIQPGKPDQNAYIERFNRSYRNEVLDAYALRIDHPGARSHGHLAGELQPRAAPRQPRPGAAAHVSAEDVFAATV